MRGRACAPRPDSKALFCPRFQRRRLRRPPIPVRMQAPRQPAPEGRRGAELFAMDPPPLTQDRNSSDGPAAFLGQPPSAIREGLGVWGTPPGSRTRLGTIAECQVLCYTLACNLRRLRDRTIKCAEETEMPHRARTELWGVGLRGSSCRPL